MTSTTEIILVRHGETDWNKVGRLQGILDSQLNDQGYEQARLLAERFRNRSLDAIWTSDLSRTMETAKEVNRHHGVTITEEPGLREINLGQWQGYTFAEVRARYPAEMQAYTQAPLTARIPGGENLYEALERAMPVLREIARLHAGQRVLVVTHGGIIRLVLCSLLGAPLENRGMFEQDNTAVNIIRVMNSKWVLSLINDVCHLGQRVTLVGSTDGVVPTL